MNQKKFFRTFMGIFVAAILLLLPANYYVDCFGVFHRYKAEPILSDTLNDRFLKMRYLLNDEQYKKYDSYLWGSSRTMKMDPEVTGEKTYNLSVPAGMTEDCYKQLRQLLEKGASIHTIYIGIDDLSYTRIYEPIKNEFRWKSYETEWNQNLGTYAGYLMSPSALINALKLESEHPGRTFLHSSGMLLIPDFVDENIEKDPGKHIVDRRFTDATQNRSDKSEFDACLRNLNEIKQICDSHSIQMKVFFNPQHMTTYLADDMELMNRLKKELVKITPFWDFSGVNYVTANNYFWYETSHPRAFICDKILDTVSGQNKITWVPDFGVYVTPENVDTFCEKAVRDREAYDPDHEQWVPTAEERAVMTKRVNYPW